MSCLKDELFEGLDVLLQAKIMSEREYKRIKKQIENDEFYNWKEIIKREKVKGIK